MSKEKDKLLDHIYDGIQEYDNPLPPWWLWLFIITVIWGVVYFFVYDIANISENKQVQLYEQEVTEFDKSKASTDKAETLVLTDADFVVSSDAAVIDLGKKVYVKNCVACHLANGEGGIGPNLTDNFWIHGGEFKNIALTVLNGVPEKGMTTWKGILKKNEILAVANYIWTMNGTNPPNAKAPQGTEFKHQ
jgi:cytochrome c oxidase cbb3-type subunit 3